MFHGEEEKNRKRSKFQRRRNRSKLSSLHTREERRFFALAGDAVRSVSKRIVIGGRLMFRVACFTVGKATRHIRAVSSAYIERLSAWEGELDHEVDQRAPRFSLHSFAAGRGVETSAETFLPIKTTCP